MNIEVKKFTDLLSPAPGKCQECAVEHDPVEPHNRDSMYYNVKFYNLHDRWPTWKDAMAHCTPEMKEAWIDALAEKAVKVE